ncbi:hypothetical protein DY000_02020434 [Brassica cretica]|uniref:Uncharacterized protein n=1 Tax=Brassica cretica TaxID=69181 RepID=A0ABQ7EL58_BRACR|nr:hypothetical protein DY000_02020434 [Brassica cretica]
MQWFISSEILDENFEEHFVEISEVNSEEVLPRYIPRNFPTNRWSSEFPRNSVGKFRGISEEKRISEELFPRTCFVGDPHGIHLGVSGRRLVTASLWWEPSSVLNRLDFLLTGYVNLEASQTAIVGISANQKLLAVDVEPEVMSLPVITPSSCFGNGDLASSTSSIKYGGVNKIETVTVSELNTYVVNSKPQVPWEITISDATDSAVYVAFEAEMSKLTNLRFNSYKVFLWVKSMLFIMRVYKRESSIFVTGFSIYKAPVEICEKLAIPEAEWPRAIGELCGLIHIEEALF